MKIKAAIFATSPIVLTGAFYLFADSNASVPYPSDYRKWAVTRSFLAGPESTVAGFHHYYANEKALEGFSTGKFSEGAVIVDERLEVDHLGADSFEGKRISIAVMTKDSGRYAETGGWGFEATQGESHTLDAPAATRSSCYSCHAKQKDRDFVFSTLRK